MCVAGGRGGQGTARWFPFAHSAVMERMSGMIIMASHMKPLPSGDT